MKYMGNKSRIANHILPIILENKKEYDWYVEPFCGSLGIMDKVTGIKKIANDYNPFLIAMWYGLQHNFYKPLEIPFGLYDEYRTKYNILKKRDKTFERVRKCLGVSIQLENNDSDLTDMSAEKYNELNEYFLIGWVGWVASFNGRFFDGGYSGKTKTRDYVSEQIKNILNQVNLIGDIIFHSYDYHELYIPKKSIIYCDPPYKNSKKYDISKDFDYEKFYNWCRNISKRKDCKIFISEYEMPDDFECIWKMEVTNSMATKNTYKPIEKLFTL